MCDYQHITNVDFVEITFGENASLSCFGCRLAMTQKHVIAKTRNEDETILNHFRIQNLNRFLGINFSGLKCFR